jgi:uncharacterized membrane protein YeiH
MRTLVLLLDLAGTFVFALSGATAPAAIMDWRYLAASLAAGLIVFQWHQRIDRLAHPVRLFDAAGLALFAVAGAQKSLAYELSAVMAALLGMLTGIGGGVARDLLLARVPAVLRSELYAIAALAGAAAVVLGDRLAWPPVVTALAGTALCFALRVAAIYRDWHLPKALTEPRHPDARRADEDRDGRGR